MAWMKEHARFLMSFLKNPVATGAVLPSSRWLAALMTEGMDLPKARTVVEVGPGTGVFTEAILRETAPGTLILAVELNPEFAVSLAMRFPGVKVVNESAEHLEQHMSSHRTQADCVLSSLPWAGFPEDLQDRLLRAIFASMRPGAPFATFAYIHASKFPAARRLKKKLASIFGSVQTSRVEWRNVPPAMVYRCRKKA